MLTTQGDEGMATWERRRGDGATARLDSDGEVENPRRRPKKLLGHHLIWAGTQGRLKERGFVG